MSTLGMTSSGPTVTVRPGRSLGWWGMVALMVTEAVLFGLLIFVYFYFRAGLTPWPPPDLPRPALLSTAVRSAVLLGSSLPFALGERALQGGNRARAVVWLLVAEALAGIFMIGHVQEQFALWSELRPTATAYGTTVMTLLNFHGLHLAVGMLMAGFVLLHLVRGRITPHRPAMLEITGMYWHFVDAIWIAVAATVYLSPYVLGR